MGNNLNQIARQLNAG
ncbi:plasmid mobilization relaxosome protein MobC, partial [Klebsiella quasipneumoniae]